MREDKVEEWAGDGSLEVVTVQAPGPVPAAVAAPVAPFPVTAEAAAAVATRLAEVSPFVQPAAAGAAPEAAPGPAAPTGPVASPAMGTTSDPGIRFVEGSLVTPLRDRRRGAMALGLAALATLVVYGSGAPVTNGPPPTLSLSAVRGLDRVETTTPLPTADGAGSTDASTAAEPVVRSPLPAESLKARVREVVKAGIPGSDAQLEDRFQEMLHIAESLEYHGVNLSAKQEQAFVERFQKVKRLHLLQSTTRELDQLAAGYQIPPPSEKAKIHEDLERLQALSKSIDWVESRYSFQYSKALKAHLHQTIQVLESQETL